MRKGREKEVMGTLTENVRGEELEKGRKGKEWWSERKGE